MTRAGLVAKVVAETGMTKKQAAAVVDTVVSAMKGALAKGDRVNLIGFGTFSVQKRKAREGRNPLTGKRIRLSAKKVPVFRPGGALKDVVS